jgi:dihydrofolate reductase
MIAIVAAYSSNHVIGCHGKIPWHIPGEQTRFRVLTTGHVVIMGRRTFEEIGKPLPNRTTIVLSRTKQFHGEGCLTCPSLEDARNVSKGKQIFIAGGEGLYREALGIAERLYLTRIEKEFKGDAFFPDFDEGLFWKDSEELREGSIPYTEMTFTRIQANPNRENV